MRVLALAAMMIGSAIPHAATVTSTAVTAGSRAGAPAQPIIAARLRAQATLTRRVVGAEVPTQTDAATRRWLRAPSPVAQACWSCFGGVATAAAILSREHGSDAHMRALAIDTIDQAIRTHEQPSGEFSDGVTTGFFAVEVGISYLELRPYLDRSTRALWRESVRRVANWLHSSGQLDFYVNGNVNLRQTEVLWLAWAVTGDPQFKTAYEREWQFTIAPPGPKWAAYGLRYTQRPDRADGLDGKGYLTESAGSRPGYDPSYTMAQLDTATELYVLTRDPRYLRLMNLLFNQDLSRVNSQYVLDARSGSRKNDTIPFLSSGPAVLVSSGARPELAAFWQGQLSAMQRDYINQVHYRSVNYFKGTSSWLSMAALAVEWPHGMRAGPCNPSRSVACRELF